MQRFWLALALCHAAATAASVWDGVFTEQQAVRGGKAYAKQCASCHGDKLDGNNQTPGLAGQEFLDMWNGMSLADLFDQVQATMPADRPGKLAKSDNADILAYLLKTSGLPAGKRELPADSDKLKDIRIQSKH